MIENPTDVVVDALTNVAAMSIEVSQGNDLIGSELTRILNVYSEAINNGHGYERDKNIYLKVRETIEKSDLVRDAIADLGKDISATLNLISDII